MKRATVIIAFLVAAVSGTALQRHAHAILNGQETTGFSAVVGLSFPGTGTTEICTGVVIHPRVVLTSARCLMPAIAQNKVGDGFVFVGRAIDHAQVVNIAVVEARVHWRALPGKDADDVGVVLLANDVPMTVNIPVLNPDPLPTTLVGTKAKAVGFGANVAEPDNDEDADTDPQYLGAGRKRSADIVIKSVSLDFMLAGETGANVCRGDTGAPLFARVDDQERVIAIAGNTDICNIATSKSAVNGYLDTFIIPAVDAWVGACPKDGTCTTLDCRTTDPDCDPCGMDGTCAENCPAPDADCPAGGRFKEPCADDADCDSRNCTEAVDDPRILYCSRECEVGMDAFYCTVDMTCVETDGQSRCVYEAPSPRAQGFPCTRGAECRSGFCNPDRVCVEECDPEGAACPDGFSCRPSELAPYVCAPPRNVPSGFCSIGAPAAASNARGGAADDGRGWLGLGLLGLTAMLLVVMGRRRRGRRVV